MATADTMAVKLQKLIDKINVVTNSNDTNLINAIDTLIKKYEEIALIIEAVAGELGSINNPIEYAGNVKLEANKYYLQAGAMYLCIKSSEMVVYHPLSELTDYVKIVE